MLGYNMTNEILHSRVCSAKRLKCGADGDNFQAERDRITDRSHGLHICYQKIKKIDRTQKAYFKMLNFSL